MASLDLASAITYFAKVLNGLVLSAVNVVGAVSTISALLGLCIYGGL